MRADMAKVVTEKPRRGSSWRNRKSRATVAVDEINSDLNDAGKGADEDYGPRKLKMSRRGGMQFGGDYDSDCKDFSDLLGPLQKYLRRQVGRPWDAIYSELSAHLDKRSISGQHIWDHVWQFVQKNCALYGKTVFTRGRFGGGYEVSGLYVHPVSGLLCYAPERRYRYKKPVDPDVVKLDAVYSLCRVNGIWYRARYGHKDVYHRPVVYGPGCGARTGQVIREGYFTSEPVLQEKKQLSRAELKSYGLENRRGA